MIPLHNIRIARVTDWPRIISCFGWLQLQEGDQRMELLDATGKVIMVASGGRCVTSTCPDGIYNLNPQILELTMDTSEKTCTEPITDIYPPISTTAKYGTRLFGFTYALPRFGSS